MKLTPYFSVNTPPALPGVYLTKREHSTKTFWRAFDGKNWYYGVDDIESPSYGVAKRKGKFRGPLVNFTWCGVEAKEVEGEDGQ